MEYWLLLALTTMWIWWLRYLIRDLENRVTYLDRERNEMKSEIRCLQEAYERANR